MQIVTFPFRGGWNETEGTFMLLRGVILPPRRS